jgi:hypothetical protein
MRQKGKKFNFLYRTKSPVWKIVQKGNKFNFLYRTKNPHNWGTTYVKADETVRNLPNLIVLPKHFKIFQSAQPKSSTPGGDSLKMKSETWKIVTNKTLVSTEMLLENACSLAESKEV